MSINIAYSSEMMSQYIQGEAIGPGHKFEVLQTLDGHSLLFSIGTNGVFYLTEEQPKLETGWQQNDLSTTLQDQFSTPIQAKDFSVAQLPNSNDFGLLLALTENGKDHLYYSNAYTRNQEDNSIHLQWTSLPFDGDTPPDTFTIDSLYYATTNEQPVGVVDVQGEQDGDIIRYYIDPQKEASSKYWVPYLFPYDMNAQEATYLCDGKRVGAKVNGLYTLGTVGATAIVVFQEFFDYYGAGAAPTTRLYLPSGVQAQNLASFESVNSVPNKEGSFTDLVVAGSNGGVYYYAAADQKDQQEGILLFQNDLFKEVTTLQAYKTADKVVVWGLNRAQQVFYTQVALTAVGTGSQWSLPLAIASGVEQISTYVNRVNGGNTYFAHTGNGALKKVFQDPVTTLWTRQDIVVPTLPTPENAAQKFDAYTTKIVLTDESNLPITGVTLQVSSSCRTAVYINYHYYVLDVTPIPVPVDAQGSLYILQKTESLQAPLLTIQSADGSKCVAVNPMDKVAEQYFKLTTPENLQAATVTDDKGENTQPLLSEDTSEEDLQATAAAMTSLSDAYSNLSPATAADFKTTNFVARPTATLQLGVVSAIGETMEDFADAVVVAAGDLLDCIADATEYVIHIVQDAAQATWNFVCEIGGAVLTFVIDTIEKVVAALQAILQAIKTAIKMAIQFIKFLFSWGDIQLTKDVFKNMFVLTMQGALDTVDEVQSVIHTIVNRVETQLEDWADIGDDNNSTNITTLTSSSDTSNSSSASSDFLQYYLVNNAPSSQLTDEEAIEPSAVFVSTLEQLQGQLDNWMQEAEAEGDTSPIRAALNTFYEEIIEGEQYKTMPLEDLLKKSIAIFLEAILEVAEELLDAILDLVKEIAGSILSALATPIWIPVLSNILEEFFNTEISFSVLDVLLLVIAVPSTLGYKVLTQKAPFDAEDASTQAILEAQDFQALYQIFTNKPIGGSGSILMLSSSDDFIKIEDRQLFFSLFRLLTATCSAISACLVIPNELFKKSKGLSVLTTINNTASIVFNVLVNVLAQPAPLQNKLMNGLYYELVTINIVSKGLLLTLRILRFTKLKVNTSLIDALDIGRGLVIDGLNLVTIAVHFYELLGQFKDTPHQAVLATAQCGSDSVNFINDVMALINYITPDSAAEIVMVEMGADVMLFLVQTVIQAGESMYAGILHLATE